MVIGLECLHLQREAKDGRLEVLQHQRSSLRFKTKSDIWGKRSRPQPKVKRELKMKTAPVIKKLILDGGTNTGQQLNNMEEIVVVGSFKSKNQEITGASCYRRINKDLCDKYYGESSKAMHV